MAKKMTREEWLNLMARELNTRVFKRAGYSVNLKDVKISCGFPSTGAKGKRIGECFATLNNGNNEIFIHPVLDDSVRVAGVLAHELVHAYDDLKNGHGPVFRKIATSVGLEGRMTATTESDEFKAMAKKIVAKIGKYPHKELPDNSNRKKQTTRMIKVICPECNEYHVRMTKTMYLLAAPVCGYCVETTDISPFELKMHPEGEIINDMISKIKKAATK